jgi:hypothetical protein
MISATADARGEPAGCGILQHWETLAIFNRVLTAVVGLLLLS